MSPSPSQFKSGDAVPTSTLLPAKHMLPTPLTFRSSCCSLAQVLLFFLVSSGVACKGKDLGDEGGSGIDTASAAGQRDADGDGWVNEDDCDDTNPTIHPGVEEVCDGVDNNCEGQVDEGVEQVFYSDGDGDGYAGTGRRGCEPESGEKTIFEDCDDQDPGINPGALDVACDGLDVNCDGVGHTGVALIGDVEFDALVDALYAVPDGGVIDVCPGEHAVIDVEVSLPDVSFTLRSLSGNPEDTILHGDDGERLWPILWVEDAHTVVYENLTFTRSFYEINIVDRLNLGPFAVGMGDVQNVTLRNMRFTDIQGFNEDWWPTEAFQVGPGAFVYHCIDRDACNILVEDSVFERNLFEGYNGGPWPGSALSVGFSPQRDNVIKVRRSVFRDNVGNGGNGVSFSTGSYWAPVGNLGPDEVYIEDSIFERNVTTTVDNPREYDWGSQDLGGAVVFRNAGLLPGETNKVIKPVIWVKNNVFTDNKSEIIQTRSFISAGGAGGAIGFHIGLYEAVASERPQLNIVGNTFQGNTASVEGGAIAISNVSVDIVSERNVFLNNWSGDDGGAYYVSLVGGSFLSISDWFENNRSYFGGAVHILDATSPGYENSTQTFIDATFLNNQGIVGAGIDVSSNALPLVVEKSLFEANSGGTGSAINVWAGLIVEDSVLIGNSASLGCAIYQEAPVAEPGVDDFTFLISDTDIIANVCTLTSGITVAAVVVRAPLELERVNFGLGADDNVPSDLYPCGANLGEQTSGVLEDPQLHVFDLECPDMFETVLD